MALKQWKDKWKSDKRQEDVLKLQRQQGKLQIQ